MICRVSSGSLRADAHFAEQTADVAKEFSAGLPPLNLLDGIQAIPPPAISLTFRCAGPCAVEPANLLAPLRRRSAALLRPL